MAFEGLESSLQRCKRERVITDSLHMVWNLLLLQGRKRGTI